MPSKGSLYAWIELPHSTINVAEETTVELRGITNDVTALLVNGAEAVTVTCVCGVADARLLGVTVTVAPFTPS